MHTEERCLFCKIAAHQAPAYVLCEDTRTLAFLDTSPIHPGHALVIPKLHAESLFDISDDDTTAMMATARRVAMAIRTSLDIGGINLLQSNGVAANQTIFHVHIHVIPRLPSDGLGDTFCQRPATLDALAEMHKKLVAALK